MVAEGWRAGLHSDRHRPAQRGETHPLFFRMTRHPTGMARRLLPFAGECSAVPGWVRAISEHGGGSFAAFGRDAGVNTGAPGLGNDAPASLAPAPCREWRWEFRGLGRDAGVNTGAPGLGNDAPASLAPAPCREWRWEFRGLGRDAGVNTGAPGLGDDAPSSLAPAPCSGHGDGSFAACGRDAGLKTGAPGLGDDAPSLVGSCAMQGPLATMPV